jgi:hypothetical protein
VDVAVGVAVMVGVGKGVRVGPVGVGKGPIRAREVRAIEMRVLFALAMSSRRDSDGANRAKR